MEHRHLGVFEVTVPGEADPVAGYRLEVAYVNGDPQLQDDPYRYLPTLGELDLHLIGEGRHRQLWHALGARPMSREGDAGTAFAVWAPNARGVRVTGDFNFWDGRAHPMRSSAAQASGSCSCRGRAGRQVQVLRRGRTGPGGEADPMAAYARCRPPPRRSSTSRTPRGATATGWPSAPSAAAEQPDGRLRGAPRVVAARPVLPRAGRRARRVRDRHGVHPRGVPAGRRAPLRRLVGLPGHLLLRADLPVRHARRLPLPRRHAAPGGHRRHRRLGARALPARLLGAGRVRRHPPVRALRSAARDAAGLGHARLQLRPLRGAQLPRRQRRLLARGVPHRRPAGRRGRVDAVPGLLAQGRRVDPQQSTAAGRTWRRSGSCRRST